MKADNKYFKLVRAFPLRVIRSESDAVEANEVLLDVAMSRPKLEAGERAYFEALTALVCQYEASRVESSLLQASSIDVLKHLMKESAMSVSDLGRIIGHQPTASQVLAGRRELSKANIQRLADHFEVSTDLFMDRLRRNYRRVS